MPADLLLNVSQLGVSLGTQGFTLRDISFQVARPEIVAIIGPSGAGKSTLLKTLCGLVTPESGRVECHGTAVDPEDRRSLEIVRRRIGFVWQESSLVGRLSVAANVMTGRLGLRNRFLEFLGLAHPEDKRRALRALERVRLGAFYDRRLDQLSGGEKQRVGIARAFFAQPEIVLADEPVASLDPLLATEVLEDLSRLAREDMKVVLVTLHQLDLARRFADRIIGMSQGSIVFDGPSSELTDALAAQIYAREPVVETITAVPSTGAIASSTDDRPSRSENSSRVQSDKLGWWPRITWQHGLVGFVLLVIYFSSIQTTNMNPAELAKGTPHLLSFVGRLFPPVWDTQTLTLWGTGLGIPYPVLVVTLWETLQMAILGTTIGAVFSLPLALLAARNVSPHPLVYSVIRFLLNANRAIPDIVFALIMVAALGLGPFAGTLAIALASVGSLSKVFAEVVESVDPQPVTAVKVTGASPLFSFRYALLPQALPVMASYAILYFESNLRTATILGLVGAGGIGYMIHQYYNMFQYQKLMGAILLIIVTVSLLDRLSDSIRRRLL